MRLISFFKGTCLVGLMLPLLSVLVPVTAWPITLAENFLTQAILCGIITSLLFWHIRALRLAFSTAIIAIISAVTLWAFSDSNFVSPPVAPRKGTMIRLVHANLLGRPNALDQFSQWVANVDPDIIALTELPTGEKEPALSTFARYRYHASAFIGGPTKTLILSRLPIIDDHGAYTNQAMAVIQLPDGQAIRIAAIHPPPPYSTNADFRRRTMIRNAFSLQHQRLARAALPLLVVGDFNATPWSQILRHTAKKNDLKRLSSSRWRSTWISSWPFIGLPIDHAYGSRHFLLNAYEVGPFIGSDHLPILVDFNVHPTPS